MKIIGKKIVELSQKERDILADAINVLDALKDELGNDEFYDFEEVSEILYYIRTTDKFEIDFKDED